MKPKNVMLLGFVNKAVEYLDRQLEEEPNTRLTDLKNIDPDTLRDELSDNLDISLGSMQSTMTSLLQAGNEAFSSFIDSNSNGESLEEQMNRIFDVDFDEKKKKNQEKLASILSFYNLDSDYKKEDLPINNSVETDKYLQEIKKNATENVTNNVDNKNTEPKENEAIDSVFNEIVENENKPVENNIKENSDVDLAEEKRKLLFQKVANAYPYLPKTFIEDVYSLKESFDSEYPIGSKLIILHRIVFNDVDNLRKFVEIGLRHDYTINADENKKIVDIFKEFDNAEGRIMANIYEIANQGIILNGKYEGYNILLQEE